MPVVEASIVGQRARHGHPAPRWSGADADVAFSLLRQLPVALVDEPADLDRADQLSRRFDEHPVHDLVYVALAGRLGARLVTADDALRHRLTSLPLVIGPG